MSAAAEKARTAFDPAEVNWNRYTRARDATGFEDWLKVARKCDDYYLGQQWTEEDRATLKRQKRPALTINMVLSTVNIMLGEHSSQRMDLRFKPRNANDPDSQLADVQGKVHHQILDANHYEELEGDLFADGIIQDRGYLDVRVKFDEHMQGEVDIQLRDNATVIPDPDAKEYDPRTWKEFFIVDWLSLDDIAQAYGQKKADELASSIAAGYYGYDSVRFEESKRFGQGDNEQVHSAIDSWVFGVNKSEERQVRSVRVIQRQHVQLGQVFYFVDQRTGDMSPVPETWEDDKVQRFAAQFGLYVVPRTEKKIRWTVSADRVTLHDDWSPYRTFTLIPYFPYFRRGRPMGVVKNLIDPQDHLNKLASQELHVVNSTANSGWVVESGALQNMTLDELREHGSETGIVLEVTPGRNIEKIQPNQIPTGIDRITTRAQLNIQEISGINAAMRGEASPEVSGVALQANQRRGMVQMQVPTNNLMRTRRLLAEKILELVQQFYTEERVITITDPTRLQEEDAQESVVVNQPTPEGRLLNDITRGKYDVVISAVPSRDTHNDTQFAEAIELRNLGVAIPDHRVIEYSNLSNKLELAAEVREMAGLGEPSEEEMEEAAMLRELSMRGAAAEVMKLEKEGQEIDARIMKLIAEAGEIEGGLDSPKYRLEMEKLQQERQIKDRELATRIRLAELAHMNQLDTGALHGRAQIAVEQIRGRNQAVTKRLEGPRKSTQQ